MLRENHSQQLRLNNKKRVHVAIMRKSWGLTQKILSGEKTIESRWYKNRYKPWGNIGPGDDVYFKNSGELVKIKAVVKKVIQFGNLNPDIVRKILKKYGENDSLGIDSNDFEKYFEMFKNKRYCIIIFLKSVKKITPFDIDKSGFGAMAAWLTVNDINQIKIKNKN